MKDTKNCAQHSTLLLASVALNIFFGAFIIGRLTAPGMMPPPGHFMEMGREDHGHGGSAHGFGDDRKMPPPPFFGPEKLFTKEEMDANFAELKKHFDKSEGIRKTFAEKLAEGPVTKDEVLAHFAEMDKMMDSVKAEMQTKAAEKISGMSEEDRKEFAKKLLEKKP